MGFSHTNTIIIAFITALAFIIIYFIFKKDMEPEEDSIEVDVFSISYLKLAIRTLLNDIVNQNIAELYLNKKETKKREQQKARLNTALRSCAHGNVGEKEFVKDYIKDLLQSNLNINETTIDLVIPFKNIKLLTIQDKFEILLYVKKIEVRAKAFEELSKQFGFDEPKINENGIHYEITRDDIEQAFHRSNIKLRYIDKLEIITQRIYQEVYGFSVADELRDLNIDGISGGVSGVSIEDYNYLEEVFENGMNKKPRTYESLWIYYHGKAIHLSFLSFGSQSELVRVCKNLYTYDNVGHLTASNGYKLTYLHDSSRVVVTRPKLTSNWAFFVRKFDSAKNMNINQLIRDNGNEMAIELIKWMVKGFLNIVLSGDQSSGKTTCLRAMMGFYDARYPIRTTEQEFELWVNNMFPDLNIVCFRGTEEVSLMEAIAIEKKTDGAIMILGEVNMYELAYAFISLCQAGTRASMCTCHCVTTEDLVDYFRNSILAHGAFSNEMVAEEQVVHALDINIHWEKAANGHRYISHITEIIPYEREDLDWPEDDLKCIAEGIKRISRRRAFYTREIIIFENGQYILKNPLSENTVRKILRNLTEDDAKKFMAFHKAR